MCDSTTGKEVLIGDVVEECTKREDNSNSNLQIEVESGHTDDTVSQMDVTVTHSKSELVTTIRHSKTKLLPSSIPVTESQGSTSSSSDCDSNSSSIRTSHEKHTPIKRSHKAKIQKITPVQDNQICSPTSSTDSSKRMRLSYNDKTKNLNSTINNECIANNNKTSQRILPTRTIIWTPMEINSLKEGIQKYGYEDEYKIKHCPLQRGLGNKSIESIRKKLVEIKETSLSPSKG